MLYPCCCEAAQEQTMTEVENDCISAGRRQPSVTVPLRVAAVSWSWSLFAGRCGGGCSSVHLHVMSADGVHGAEQLRAV